MAARARSRSPHAVAAAKEGEREHDIELQCIRAIRAWKDGGYPGQALNDTDCADTVSLRSISPEESGFTPWTRETGNPGAYRDADGTARGTATLATPAGMNVKHVKKAILYLHGGGYRKYKPTDEYVVAVSTRLAKALLLPVLAIDYRLAPEFDVASRAAITDTWEGIRWLVRSFPDARIFVAGDSAGAGLALAATLACIEGDSGVVQPCPGMPSGIIMISPYIDLTMTSCGFEESMFRYTDGFGDIFYSNHDRSSNVQADRDWLRGRAKDYITKSNPDNPYCSPYFISDDSLRQFPPVIALVGGHEIFLHETATFAKRAQRLGVKCSLSIHPRMWHCWFNYCELPIKLGISPIRLRSAVRAYDEIADFMEPCREH